MICFAFILLKFSSTKCCLQFAIAIRLAIRGTLIIMPLLNTIAPGDVCIVWLIAHLEACTTVAKVLSIIFVVFGSLCGGSTCSITHSISAIVLCNRSTIVFDCGFFTVVGLMLCLNSLSYLEIHVQ